MVVYMSLPLKWLLGDPHAGGSRLPSGCAGCGGLCSGLQPRLKQ